MKKTILVLSLMTLLTACNTSTVEENTVSKDSTIVCVDTCKTDSTCVNTCTLNIDTVKK